MIITIVEYLVLGLAFLVLIPICVFAIQLFAGISSFAQRPIKTEIRQNIAVLVPAHNEESVIESTLHSIIPQLQGNDRIIVIADNCSDQTATLARNCGAEVIERNDSSKKGKGYALDYGLRYLRDTPPAQVVIVDADCQISEDTITRLVLTCTETGRPVQATYLMLAGPGAGLKTRIAAFAHTIKTMIRPRGLYRLGLPCSLFGTGNTFPWAIISKLELANGEIVEDLKMGIDLVYDGSPPIFCPDAQVISYFPTNSVGMQTQRTRWEHGHLSLIVSECPRLFVKALKSLDIYAFAMALDLCIPPLTLLILISTAVLILSFTAYLFFGWLMPLVVSVFGVALMTFAVLGSWVIQGRNILSFTDLVSVPVYIFWKIPIYLKFLVAKQVEWVRSSRE